MADDSTHRCRSGQQCCRRTPDGPALTKKPNTLCHACVDRLQYQYDELATIKEVLQLFLGGLRGQSGEAKVSTSKEPPSALNVHALDLIDEVEEVISRIGKRPIRDVVRLPPEKFRLPSGKVVMIDGVHRALQVGIVWRKADGIIGITQAWHQCVAPCPKCLLQTMGFPAGSDTVQCSNCGSAMTRDEYVRICTISPIRSKGSIN